MGVDPGTETKDGIVRIWYAGPFIEVTEDLPGNDQDIVGTKGPSQVAKRIFGKPCRGRET